MQNRRNYYRLLQVQPDAAPEVIKASYRTLMQKLRLHPDLGGDEWNALAPLISRAQPGPTAIPAGLLWKLLLISRATW